MTRATGSENKCVERRDTTSVDNKNSSRTERRYVINTNNEENGIYSIGGGHCFATMTLLPTTGKCINLEKVERVPSFITWIPLDSSNIVGGVTGDGNFTSPIGGTSSRNLRSGIGGWIVGGEVRANLKSIIGGNFNNGISGSSISGALISAIGGIESGNLCRRIVGGIISVGVEVRASLSSSIYGQFKYGITGGSIDVILVNLSNGIGGSLVVLLVP
ncbi:hypothetical protein AgCh_023045 [Apium graveolens]